MKCSKRGDLSSRGDGGQESEPSYECSACQIAWLRWRYCGTAGKPGGNRENKQPAKVMLFGARDAGVMPGVAKGGRKVETEDGFVVKTTRQLPHG